MQWRQCSRYNSTYIDRYMGTQNGCQAGPSKRWTGYGHGSAYDDRLGPCGV